MKETDFVADGVGFSTMVLIDDDRDDERLGTGSRVRDLLTPYSLARWEGRGSLGGLLVADQAAVVCW